MGEYLDKIKQVRSNLYRNLNHRNYNLIDCFKEEFHFIRKFDEYRFNRKMNVLGITPLVLEEEYDLTDILKQDIENPIKYGSNMTFGFKGYTGTGKSEGAIKLALLSKIANKQYKNRVTNGRYGFHLCWDKNEFEAILKLLKDGDVILKDEMPKHEGKGRIRQDWSIENILDTVRMMENTFIFVDPRKINMSCNILLESAGMDRKTRINRFMILDEKENYYGHVYIKLHEDKELRAWYETEKKKFIDRNLKLGGKHTVKVIDAELEDIEIKEKLNEMYDYLWDKYEPKYKIEDKGRNIMICCLHRLDFTDKQIKEISGCPINTLRDIYKKIEQYFN